MSINSTVVKEWAVTILRKGAERQEVVTYRDTKRANVRKKLRKDSSILKVVRIEEA